MKVLHPTLISKWKFAWNRFRKKQIQSNNLNPNGIHRSFGFRMDLNPCKSLFWKGRRSLFKMNCMDYRHDKISTGWPMRNISKQSDANASSLQLRRRAALFSKNLRNHCDRLIKLSSVMAIKHVESSPSEYSVYVTDRTLLSTILWVQQRFIFFSQQHSSSANMPDNFI